MRAAIHLSGTRISRYLPIHPSITSPPTQLSIRENVWSTWRRRSPWKGPRRRRRRRDALAPRQQANWDELPGVPQPGLYYAHCPSTRLQINYSRSIRGPRSELHACLYDTGRREFTHTQRVLSPSLSVFRSSSFSAVRAATCDSRLALCRCSSESVLCNVAGGGAWYMS